jgi:uncharacterized protein (DUF1810 family)
MSDPFNLLRFVEAQAPVYHEVVQELRKGQKQSHWMWFVFPQIAGLGSSAMARRYAISGLDEARDYLDHPVLGPRLTECTQLALASASVGATELFGRPDDLKFRSSMTLFNAADKTNELFASALQQFFKDVPDDLTLARIQK